MTRHMVIVPSLYDLDVGLTINALTPVMLHMTGGLVIVVMGLNSLSFVVFFSLIPDFCISIKICQIRCFVFIFIFFNFGRDH